MNKRIVAMVLICILAVPAFCKDLRSGFVTPPESAKPGTWYFWQNGNISKEQITGDLEAMKKVGIGSIVVYNISQTPDGEIEVLGDEWRDCMRHVADEADRLGLSLFMQNSPGWSGSGNPLIKPEDSMQTITWTETRMTGPTVFSGVLEKPRHLKDYYRDITVLAFPTPDGDKNSLAEYQPEISATFDGFDGKKLIDGDESTFCRITKKDAASGYIQLEFPEPLTSQTIIVTFRNEFSIAWRVGADARLETSRDGSAFTRIAQFNADWNYLKTNTRTTMRFPEITTRYYRISFPRLRGPFIDLAEIRLLSSPRIPYAEFKGGFFCTWGHGRGEQYLTPRADDKAGIPQDRVVDLSKNMDSDGVLRWDVPDGEWTVLRIGHTTNGHVSTPAPSEATGLECDKLDSKGFDKHFNHYIDTLIGENNPLGNKLDYLHFDSWEVGSQNWTGILPKEFKKRRGYDLIPWLPAITGGYVIEDGETTERFLRDFRVTLAELIKENYYGRALEIGRKRGIKLNTQASGAWQFMFDSLDMQTATDLPEGENWTSDPRPRPDCKMVSSVAHTCGLPSASSEAFTNPHDKGTKHPFAVKGNGDLTFCLGIDRLMFNNFAHHPWMDHPDIHFPIMMSCGIYFNRDNTWWDQSAAWLDYLTRCQYLLSRGQFVADIISLTDEEVPNHWSPSIPAGYDYDGCPDEVFFKKMSVKDGRIVLSHGMNYSLLLLPDTETMTLKRLLTLKKLVASGATIVGPKPKKSPTLAEFPSRDEQIKQIADELWGKDDTPKHTYGKGVVYNSQLKEVLRAMDIQPDFEYAPAAGNEINYIHRTVENKDIYFLANNCNRHVDMRCTFRVSGKFPELWHPDTGGIEKSAIYKETNGRIEMPVHFDPFGSVFVVFSPDPRTTNITEVVHESENASHDVIGRIEHNSVVGEFRKSGRYRFMFSDGSVKTVTASVPDPVSIEGPWEVHFDPALDAPSHVEFDKLISWPKHDHPGIKYYSGTARYSKKFNCPENVINPNNRLYLDLGTVEVIAEVTLNGKTFSTLWKPPFRVEVTDYIKPKENLLSVEVVNLWPNRLIGDERLPKDMKLEKNFRNCMTVKEWPDWLLENKPRPSGRHTFTFFNYYDENDELLPSGLLGPVKLRVTARHVIVSK